MNIKLGTGRHIVTDISDNSGKWAGIAISEYECKTGEIVDTGAKTVGDLSPLVTIETSSAQSLDAIIAACERAKFSLKTQN